MQIKVKGKKDVAIVEMSLFELRVMSSMLKKQKQFEIMLGLQCTRPGCNCQDVSDHIIEVVDQADRYLEDLRDNPMEDSKPW